VGGFVVRRTLIASISVVLLAAPGVAFAMTYTGQTRMGTSTTGQVVHGCAVRPGLLTTDLVIRCAKSSNSAELRYDFTVPATVSGVTWQVNWLPGTTHPGVTAALTRPKRTDVRISVRAKGISHADVATVVIEYYTH
jgi:hypothetical protein